jgi:hypothetical protein
MAMTFDAEALPSLRTIASVLGGVVSGRSVLAPGPDHHSPQDRSLSVTPDAKAPGGFLVHSFAGDDELRCKDYVREKLAMPAFKPARERERVQQPKKPISTTRMRPAVPCLVRYGAICRRHEESLARGGCKTRSLSRPSIPQFGASISRTKFEFICVNRRTGGRKFLRRSRAGTTR